MIPPGLISFLKSKPPWIYELTPEKVMEIGKGFEDAFLACLPVDKRLKGLKPEDILPGSSLKNEWLSLIHISEPTRPY